MGVGYGVIDCCRCGWLNLGFWVFGSGVMVLYVAAEKKQKGGKRFYRSLRNGDEAFEEWIWS